jgi:serine/threonine protein phosphatase 1
MTDYQLPPPTNPYGGRRYVIADVHGSAKTLWALVEDKLKLKDEDQLFLLGDYIDRGNGNAKVLEFIMDLQIAGFKVYPLRGNHEQMLLDEWQNFNIRSAAAPHKHNFRIESGDLLDASGRLPDRYLSFLVSLPYYFELDKFYLVHAGINFSAAKPLEDYETMLWTRRAGPNPTPKTVVHGHQVTDLLQIARCIQERSRIIPLDNGCYYASGLRKLKSKPAGVDLGNLCALDLDDWQLFVQENVD